MKTRTLSALTLTIAVMTASAIGAAPAWRAYHDRNGINHQIESDKLRGEGYRLLSLSTYGPPASPSYAAVWVKRGGAEQHAFHGLTLAQFDSKFGTESASGFKLAMITSTGTSPNARFAGVFEKTSGLTAIYPLTAAMFDQENVKQKKAGKMLRSATDFGPAGQPIYIGIWEPNPDKVAWTVGHNLTAEVDQQWFHAQKAQWARPSYSTRTSSGRYISIYRDDQIGEGLALGDLTSAAYQAEVDKAKAQGFYPLSVQGSGQGAGVRFSAIFVKSEKRAAREWRTPTGPAVPALAAFDDVVRKHMQATAVRAGAVAVTRNGKLVLARGYTYAEPEYPQTQPVSLFRIASCSKPITSIAIHQLIEQGKLSLNDNVQDILDTTPAGGSPDPNYQDIKVWHLLSHLGGRLHGPDLPDHFKVRDALKKQFPLKKSDLAAYMAGQPLDFDPDPGPKPWKFDYYSNMGYLLLGQIIEKKTGVAYAQAVRSSIWKPLGVTRPQTARSRVEDAWPGEVRYHDRDPNGLDLRVSPSVVHPDAHLVPLAYGGENYQTFDSFGGWVVSAPDYAKLLASFDLSDHPLFAKDAETVKTMWSNPEGYGATNPDLMRGWFATPRSATVTQYGHGGGTPGVATFILHRTDGISIVAFFNGAMDWIEPDLNAAADAVTDWPKQDLFLSVAQIPPFPKLSLAPQTKLVKSFPATWKPKRHPSPDIVTPSALRPASKKRPVPIKIGAKRKGN